MPRPITCSAHLNSGTPEYLAVVQIGGYGLHVSESRMLSSAHRVWHLAAAKLAGLREGRLLALKPCPAFSQEGKAWAKPWIVGAGEGYAEKLLVVGAWEPV